jgi:hypothetical protein
MNETCWICKKEKGQPPERCPGHYDMPQAIAEGMTARERLIREGFCFDSDRDCDAAKYLIGVIDTVRWDRSLLRRCSMCKHDPPEGEADKDCICGGTRTAEGELAGLRACIQYWREKHADESGRANVLSEELNRSRESLGTAVRLKLKAQEENDRLRAIAESLLRALDPFQDQIRSVDDSGPGFPFVVGRARGYWYRLREAMDRTEAALKEG